MEQGFARGFSQLQDRQYHLVPGVIYPYNWAFFPRFSIACYKRVISH